MSDWISIYDSLPPVGCRCVFRLIGGSVVHGEMTHWKKEVKTDSDRQMSATSVISASASMQRMKAGFA